MSDSKPIGKTDDSAKQFIIDCLQGEDTHGFDIDQIYFYQNHYYIIEYLKCEHADKTPHTSNPKYYPSNWKKFYSLWKVSRLLDGYLLLVNYADDYRQNEVKLMYVRSFNNPAFKQLLDGTYKKGPLEYMQLEEYNLTKDEYSDFLKRLNNGSSLDGLVKKQSAGFAYEHKKPIYPKEGNKK